MTTREFSHRAQGMHGTGSLWCRRLFQKGSSRREEALISWMFEPRYLGCYGVLQTARVAWLYLERVRTHCLKPLAFRAVCVFRGGTCQIQIETTP